MLGKIKTVSGHKAPISSHPIFPAVVAVWFAALLGVGSLILPVVIFEKLFSVSGLSSLVPATQAPLGMTARLLIGITAAGAGAGIGLLIARKVAASQFREQDMPQAHRQADPDKGNHGSIKRPISALEELGSASFDEPIDETTQKNSFYKGKRRALAVSDDSGPSEFLDFAPLPGSDLNRKSDHQILDVGDLDTLELEAFAGNEEDENVMESAGVPFGRKRTSPHIDPGSCAIKAEQSEFGNPSSDNPSPNNHASDGTFYNAPAAESPAVEDSFSARLTQADPTDLTEADLHPADDLQEEFAPMTHQDDQPLNTNYNPFADQQPANETFVKPFAAEKQGGNSQPNTPFTAQHDVPNSIAAAQDVQNFGLDAKPLHELGMTELVERFAMALQSKSAASAVAVEAALPSQAHAVDESPPMVFRRSAPAVEAGPVAAPDAPPAEPEIQEPDAPVHFNEYASASLPAALDPFGLNQEDADEDGEEAERVDLSLVLGGGQEQSADTPARFQANASANASDWPAQLSEEDEGGDGDDTYSSLLTMKSSLGASHDFVRVEDEEFGSGNEPVVVFPGQGDRQTQPSAGTPQSTAPSVADTKGMAQNRPFDGPLAHEATSVRNSAVNPGETERALRDALAKLQRMSGAA